MPADTIVRECGESLSQYPQADNMALSVHALDRLKDQLNSCPGALDNRPKDQNRESYMDWESRDYVAYGQWIFELSGRPAIFTINQLRCASKLGLGPSISTISHAGLDLRELTRPPNGGSRLEVDSLNHDELVELGKKIADDVDRRIGVVDLKRLRKQGKFVSLSMIIARFLSLSNFQEYIGRPHSYGWKSDDFIEWGAEVLRQNPNIDRMNLAFLEALSKRGVGPDHLTVTRQFKSIEAFSMKAECELHCEQVSFEKELTGASIAAEVFLAEHPDIKSLIPIHSIAEKDMNYMRIVAAAQLAVELCGTPSKCLKKNMISKESLSGYVIELARISGRSAAEIECYAIEMNLYDLIWGRPPGRFEHVDLRFERPDKDLLHA